MGTDTVILRQVVDQAIDEHPSINKMEADIEVLKSDVGTLKSDVSTLKAETQRQGVLMEDMDRKMDRLIDALLPAKHREIQMDRLEEVTDSHELRLGAVETAVKTHIGDSERHR